MGRLFGDDGLPAQRGEIDNVTVEYLDNDGDGMVSSGDVSVVSYPSDFAHGYEIQPYDTWAEEYSADSALIGPELPGFGAFLSLIGLAWSRIDWTTSRGMIKR